MRAIEFLKLGFYVREKRPPRTQAARNTTAFFRSQYIDNGKLLDPSKADHLFEKCNKILARLMEVAGINHREMKLHIIKKENPNAWIFKGTGDVFVTTGLLEKENITEGELSSVLSHEIGHYLKGQPNRKLPKRIKNPLFRQYAQATQFARQQNEEFEGNELGLVIHDAAGFSVDEYLAMDEWLASRGSEATNGAQSGVKVLRPDASHPHMASLQANIRETINNPLYVWQNRTAPSEVLLDARAKEQLDNKHVFPKAEHDQFNWSDLDPLDTKTIDRIALHAGYDEGEIVYYLYNFLSSEKFIPKEELKTFILKLKKQAEKGDIVANAYFQTLLCKLYFDSVKSESAAAQLDWLENECKVKREEVILSLLALLGNLDIGDADYDSPTESLTLEGVVGPFPPSYLRDQLIGQLLKDPGRIADRYAYIDEGFEQTTLPFSGHEFTSGKILRLLHGTSIVDSDIFEKTLIITSLKPDSADDNSVSLLDYSIEMDLSRLFTYMFFFAGPYDQARLETLLQESVNSITAMHPRWWDPVNYKDADLQSILMGFHSRITECANSFRDGFIKQRLFKFGRIVILRYLEAIPAKEWTRDIVQLVENLPPSSEKNHLLVLMHKAGVRTMERDDLVFEPIPRPDEAEAQGVNLTLLNSFGFVDQHAAEAIYPSGQRILDNLMAERLSKQGVLTINRVCRLIPRPSPARDDLLDRCGAKNSKQARALLNAYWSPTAAYSKAYQISKNWLEQEGGENQETFRAICSVTHEFPSLKRRMIGEWSDRFGVSRDEYPQLLQAGSDVDVVDIYKGGLVEQSRGRSQHAKAAICLASFSFALTRDGFSLLSIQELEALERERDVMRILSKAEEDELGRGTQEIDDEIALRFREKKKKMFFNSYQPLLPENASSIAQILLAEAAFSVHSIPFVDGKPQVNPRFERAKLATKTLSELKKWEGGSVFSNFMQALGWREAIAFYEELFFGNDGLVHNPELFQQMEDLFIQGIGLLLQEKNVPLARVNTVKKGMKNLLTHQPMDIRAQVWVRILAGISQKQSLGEITRAAVSPLKSPGGKLMQAINSLTTGVDPTLEEATRLSLDQTANFSLFDAIRFLGFRLANNPFEYHDKYTLLGEGTVRAGIAGYGGAYADEAFLEVHATEADSRVVAGITQFIRKTSREGYYFPLTEGQFISLVAQTEAERIQGFKKHQKFGDLFGWQIGSVAIPKIIEQHSDWARLQIITGTPFSQLSGESRVAAAQKIVEGVFAQFRQTTIDGKFLINPETHGGNFLIDSLGTPWLVDCGLTGEATWQDLSSLFGVFAAFRTHGLNGAAASIFQQNGVTSLTSLSAEQRQSFLDSMGVLAAQLRAETAPELLLPGLTSVVNKTTGNEMAPGIDTLFRALQHSAPYFREVGGIEQFSKMSTMFTQSDPAKLAIEIQRGLDGVAKQQTAKIVPKGIAVGKILLSGSIAEIGVLIDDLDLEEKAHVAGMVKCKVEGLAQFVRKNDLRIQRGNDWITLEEYLS